MSAVPLNMNIGDLIFPYIEAQLAGESPKPLAGSIARPA